VSVDSVLWSHDVLFCGVQFVMSVVKLDTESKTRFDILANGDSSYCSSGSASLLCILMCVLKLERVTSSALGRYNIPSSVPTACTTRCRDGEFCLVVLAEPKRPSLQHILNPFQYADFCADCMF
jgi:hypothetical protein